MTGKNLECCLISLFCLVSLAVAVNAQAIPVWSRWEQTFTATTAVTPETQFHVKLAAPSGKTLTVAGFWDGGATWRVRFMPAEPGIWQYRTYSVPAVDGLNGHSGTFVSRKHPGNSRFTQHGPVRISANGRFFEHADGLPFFWMGDTAWYGAILSSEADWNAYLADRTSKKFNVVHFNVVAPRIGVATDENGEVSFAGAERLKMPSRLFRLFDAGFKLFGMNRQETIRMNARFYQRLDERIDAVNSYGLLAAIVLTWASSPDDSGNVLPEAEVVRLIRYLESRYGANHVVWILTGDNAYTGYSNERWKRIGRAAFGGRVHAPVSTHPNSMLWPWESFRDEKWLDFYIYQSGHGDDDKALRWIHSGPPSRHWENQPPRPFINLEPPYEGLVGYHSRKPHSDYTTRRAIYWSLLNAPTAGVSYGAHGVWSWHTVPGKPPTDLPNSGIAKTWHEALSFAGSTQMKYLEEFFTSIPWWTLRPDQKVLDQQPAGDDPAVHVSAARSETRDLAVLYLPVGSKLKLKKGALRKDLRAHWFNPRNGQRTSIKHSRQEIFEAPDQQDWLLLLSSK